jgi:2-polyprenyl-3-methyl-5-hydroxy-6-metoxy-1,4-benzoquinol methylase
MGRYYPDDYGPYLGTRVPAAGAAGGGRGVLRRAYRAIFRYRSDDLPPLPPGRLLEIGCASGAFLRRMAGEGWAVSGVEFSASAAASARAAGLDVHAGAVEDAPPPPGELDLVVGWMVLEHLHRPVEVLARLAAWSRPGAWLALSVPNAASADLALFGDCAYALQLPTHLYHFTPETLAQVLARGGWRVERVLQQRTLANWFGGLALALEARGWLPGLAAGLRRLATRPRLSAPLLYPLSCLAAALGQTGRMTVWARRVGPTPAPAPPQAEGPP